MDTLYYIEVTTSYIDRYGGTLVFKYMINDIVLSP